MSRKLPAWRDEWSDGCTASPNWGWWGDHVEACRRHDESYYYGGSRRHRRLVDVYFLFQLLGGGMPAPIAYVYFVAVRIFGTPLLRIRGVSWSFGDNHFRYGAPAVPA